MLAATEAGDPVVFSARRGAGAVIFSGALDAWRYGGSEAFAKFWRRVIAEEAVTVPPALEVSVDPSLVAVGAPARVRARLRATEFSESALPHPIPDPRSHASADATPRRDRRSRRRPRCESRRARGLGGSPLADGRARRRMKGSGAPRLPATTTSPSPRARIAETRRSRVASQPPRDRDPRDSRWRPVRRADACSAPTRPTLSSRDWSRLSRARGDGDDEPDAIAVVGRAVCRLAVRRVGAAPQARSIPEPSSHVRCPISISHQNRVS